MVVISIDFSSIGIKIYGPNTDIVYAFEPIFIASAFSLQFYRGPHCSPFAGNCQPLNLWTGPPANSVPCATILSFWLSSIWVRVEKFFVKYIQF